MRSALSLLVVGALLLFAAPAHAAFISIDDNDPGFITITAGDFESGFSVDGTLLTSGIGDSGSVTFADSGHSFSGSWIDLGASGRGGHTELQFAPAATPTLVTSGMEFSYSTDGFSGSLSGSFGGYTGIPYFLTADPTFVQDGHVESGAVPFLSFSFDSEAATVPEPATLLMLVPGAALFARRRFARR